MSPRKYYSVLKDAHKYSDKIAENIESVGHFLKHIRQLAVERINDFNPTKFDQLFNKLYELNEVIVAYSGYQAEYEGAKSVVELLPIYLTSPYRHISNFDKENLGDLKKQKYMSYMKGGQPSVQVGYKEHCENLYHAVDRFLMTSKSKSALIDRLKTYCTWIRRDDFPKPKDKNKESRISKIVTEFIFNHGYFPIVRPKTGKAEPDILFEPSNIVSWDNSVLLELKQYIREEDQESEIRRELPNNIGQAAEYYSIVKEIKRDIADTVHLLIFYNGKKRFQIGESYPVEKNVVVDFIYVGDGTPSKLETVIIDGK